MNRCLILGCSERKNLATGVLPAISRYDGPLFKVLRRYLHEHSEEAPDVYILSAEFGLISGARGVPYYDRRMTPQRAQELRPHVLAELGHILQNGSYHELFICIGSIYRQVLAGYETVLLLEISATICNGASGKMQADLRDWLYGGLQPQEQVMSQPRGYPQIRGIRVELTREQILNLARQSLQEGQGDHTCYQSWYVLIDGKRVSPKWLVSQITGLAVSRFGSSEARRLLAQIGVEVVRV